MNRIFIAMILFFGMALTSYSQNSKEDFYKFVGEKKFEEAEALISQVSSANQKDYKLLMTCGYVYFELEKYKNANEFYAKAYDIKDDDQELNRQYSLGLAETGDFKNALKIIKQTIKDNPKVVSNYLTASEIYIKADSLSEAEIQIDRAMAIDPKNPDIYVASGNFYFARRVYELARDNYEKAIGLDSTIVEAHLKLATSYYWLATRELDKDLGNELFARSLREWNTVSKLDSMNSKAFFEQGKIWFFAERYTEAANALSRYVKLRPTGSLGRWYLAQSLYNIGEWANAIPNLEQAANEIDSVKIQAKQDLADCYLAVKNYTKAKETYQELETNSTKFSSIDYRKYGQSCFLSGDTLSAIKNFRKAIDMDKENNCNLMYFLGTLLSSQKNYAASNEILLMRLNTGTCQDSLNSKVYYIIGSNFIFSNQADSSITYLEKSLELDPKNMFAEIYLGDAYIQIKNEKLGLDKYKSVIAKEEADPTLNRNALLQAFAKLSNYYLDKKNYQELNKNSKRWSELFPENAFSFLYLAVSYQGMNDKENACKNYSKVLKIDPNNSTAKKNRELLSCGQ